MLPGLIGVVQATETVKLLLGKGEPLIGRLLTYDALGMRFREVRLRRDPKCPLCGERAGHPRPVDPRRGGRGVRPGGRDGRADRPAGALRPAPRRQRGARGARVLAPESARPSPSAPAL